MTSFLGEPKKIYILNYEYLFMDMTGKVIMRVVIAKDLHKRLWETAYRLAIETGKNIRGIYTDLIRDALQLFINDAPKIDLNVKYRAVVSTTIWIDKELRNKLLDVIIKKYGTKYGNIKIIVNKAIEYYLNKMG